MRGGRGGGWDRKIGSGGEGHRRRERREGEEWIGRWGLFGYGVKKIHGNIPICLVRRIACKVKNYYMHTPIYPQKHETAAGGGGLRRHMERRRRRGREVRAETVWVGGGRIVALWAANGDT